MKRPLEEQDVINRKKLNSKSNQENNDDPRPPERIKLEKKLSEMIRLKKKFISKIPRLVLTLDNLKSFEKSMEDNEKMEWIMPQFFVQDIQRVVLFGIIGDKYRFFPRWCKLLRPNHLKSVNLIAINNISEFDYKHLKNQFENFEKLFLNYKNELNTVEFVSPSVNGNSFLNEFISVPISRSEWIKIRDKKEFLKKRNIVVEQYKKLFEKLNSEKQLNKIDTSQLDKIPRTSLMMNLVQMIREDYPLPFDHSSSKRLKDYVYTKQEYKPVSDSSPLFSIDCEMCFNIDGESEVVWLAIANEALECVYETFVKPRKQIKNFLTHITGISKKHLEDIETDLSHVQQKIQEILPPDAILCGQSLNNDLHALKMFHPYIIDTSIIYNISGNRDIKPSLRRLAAQFLGKIIQESTHNPIVDAKASIQLVLLKLRQSLDFGDVIINGCTNIYNLNQCETSIESMCLKNTDLSDVDKISKFIYQTGLNIDQNFFNVLLENSVNNVYIDRIKNKKLQLDANSVYVNDNEEAFKKLHENLNKCKFGWTQLYMNTDPSADVKKQIDKKELKKLLSHIEEVYQKLDDDSMLVVVLTGRIGKNINLLSSDQEFNLNDLNRGRCFFRIKNNELDKKEADVKQLYDKIYPNGKKDDLGVILPDSD